MRIQTDIRIGSRTDKSQTMEDKVNAVNRLLLAEDGEEPGMKHEKGTTRGAPNATTGPAEVSSVVPDSGEEPGMRHERDTTTGAPDATTLAAEVSSVIPDQ